MEMFKNVLVALDGSKHAKRAAVAAADLAQRYKSRLLFITVMKKTPIRISNDAIEKILADAERHARNKGVKNVRTDAQSGPVARFVSACKRCSSELPWRRTSRVKQRQYPRWPRSMAE
jgi:nucleotide-binding universal stress UspA family protein